MKRLTAVFALTVLGASAAALAQQTYQQQTPQQPPPSATQSQQETSPADKQALMKDCLTKVQAANPNASEKDVKAYCDQKVKEYSSPQK